MRVSDGRLLRTDGDAIARHWLARPGSTIKPFSLLALLEAGKVTEKDAYVCPRKLTVAGRDFTCVHPEVPQAMNVSRAIAYSCNCAVAHFAQRFQRDELAAALVRAGFKSVRRNLSSAAPLAMLRSSCWRAAALVCATFASSSICSPSANVTSIVSAGP